MNPWVEAARPKTLSASIAPVLVGTAVAENFIAWRFLAALVVAVSLQIAVNFANDYFDAIKGVDAEREGPRRLVASGVIPRSQMLLGMLLAFLVAGGNGALLAWQIGWHLLWVGAAAVIAALLYSGGPRPYGAAALGEIFVFIFFGLIATAGSAYVQDESISMKALACGVPVGLLATCILMANNLRDVESDYRAGKVTMVAIIGRPGIRAAFSIFVAAVFLDLFAISLIVGSLWPLLAMGALPLALRSLRIVRSRTDAKALVAGLALTARAELIYGVLLATGLLISS